MWLRLLRPDVLFLAGTLQALAPFALYSAGQIPELTMFHVNYLAALISVIGYLSFWLGTRLVPTSLRSAAFPDVPVSFKTLKVCLVFLSLVGLAEIVGLSRVYGGIPLLLFASGATSVNDTNQAEAASGFGQIGIAFLTSSMLFSAVTLLAIKARIHKTSLAFWIVLPSLLATILIIFNGKRQGLVMYASIIAVAAALSLGSPFRLIDAIFGTRGRSGLSTIVGLGFLVLALFTISSLVRLRNNGAENPTVTELGTYYIYPMMGLSGLCNQVGLGPFEFKPMGVFSSLLPVKLSPPASWVGTPPPRFEPTAGDGFYERLQWDTGLWGIIFFPFLCGLFSQWMYKLAFRRYAALLSYSFVAWSLFSSAIYNHFLELMFLPLPVIIFWTVSFCRREFASLLMLSTSQVKLKLPVKTPPLYQAQSRSLPLIFDASVKPGLEH